MKTRICTTGLSLLAAGLLALALGEASAQNLPARIKIVNQSILQYNAMQISPFELFTAKAEELRVERAYIDALREYWITRAELEKAVGGSLNPRSSTDKKVIPKQKK